MGVSLTKREWYYFLGITTIYLFWRAKKYANILHLRKQNILYTKKIAVHTYYIQYNTIFFLVHYKICPIYLKVFTCKNTYYKLWISKRSEVQLQRFESDGWTNNALVLLQLLPVKWVMIYQESTEIDIWITLLNQLRTGQSCTSQLGCDSLSKLV